MERFTDKTVIITGSSSGIGLGVAKRFAEEGANVVLNSIEPEELKEAAKEFDDDRTLMVEGDVSDSAFCKSLIDQTVDRFGGLDVLHNNAGVAAMGPFADSSDEDIDKVLSVNVKGVLVMSREAYPHLKKSKGCIVNTSSVSGIGGDYELAIYDASKGAITNLTRALALEWGLDGIRVNAVNPSIVESDLTENMLENDDLVDAFKRRLAIERVGKPSDIAGAVAFLASEDAAWITGVNLPVDGGCSASNGQPNFRRSQ